MNGGTIGIIGVGEIGSMIAGCLIADGQKLIGSRRSVFTFEGMETTTDNVYLAEHSDVIIIAVRQKDLEGVCAQIACAATGKLVISVVAGVELQYFESRLAGSRAIRAMTNIAFAHKSAMSAYCASSKCTAEDCEVAEILLGSGGDTIRIDESKMDGFTAVVGCGIGLFSYILGKFKEAAAQFGFIDAEAERMVSMAAAGAVSMSKGASFDEVVRKVRTRGGMTDAGIAVFEAHSMGDAIRAAEVAARDRGAELNLAAKGKRSSLRRQS